MSKNNNNNIAKAKASLIIDQLFFASILLPMKIYENKEIPTFATDGESIVYNPEWASKLSLSETIFVLAHGTLHIVFEHLSRRGDRTPNRWNQATDYIINQVLTDEGVGTMPKGGLLNRDLVLRGKGTAEGVYSLLPKSAEKNKSGSKKGSLDDLHAPGSEMGSKEVDQATKSEKAAEMKVRVLQARNAAKAQGQMSQGLDRLVSELVKPHVNWREVLRKFLSDRCKLDLSYSKPKRRFLGEDFILPSLIGEKMGIIDVAVDCSGSIDQELLNKYAAEINAIKEDVNPRLIRVHYFDSRHLGTQEFDQDSAVTLEPRGGGGTDFAPIFQHIKTLQDSPIACLVLTDLCCNRFGEIIPEYPVLWCVLDEGLGYYHGQANVPFGEILEIKIDE